MDTGPAFWLIMTVGGAVLLGIALTYGLISTRRRRDNPVAQRLTDAATRELYQEEEDRRVRQETAAGDEEARPPAPSGNLTEPAKASPATTSTMCWACLSYWRPSPPSVSATSGCTRRWLADNRCDAAAPRCLSCGCRCTLAGTSAASGLLTALPITSTGRFWPGAFRLCGL
jgi:hypothetical protein